MTYDVSSKEKTKKLYDDCWKNDLSSQIPEEELLSRPLKNIHEKRRLWGYFFDKTRIELLKKILMEIGVTKNTKIIDIGCGNTEFAKIYDEKTAQ
ncbi:MAG: hypothetical protein AB1779_05930 [Candidatus Thermoplasmatota archaeon]